jgi:LysR family transcriptional regulator, hca operon transcriptional activator
MELRHRRYFIAVAEAESLAIAAQQMLHTSQASLSRQIRDLEDDVGTQLLTRRARGIELTPAGRAFLEHARSVLSQVEAATEVCSPCRSSRQAMFLDRLSDRTRIDLDARSLADLAG